MSNWTVFKLQSGPALVDSPAELHQLMRDLPGLVARLDMLCSDSALGDLAAEPKRTTYTATGNAMAHELWFGEQLAASRLVITSNEMVLMVKTTYAEKFARFAPGRQLLHRVVEHLFTMHSGSVIEFYTNASVDQLAWATGQREIRHISFYTDSFTASLFNFLRNFRNRFFSRPTPQ